MTQFPPTARSTARRRPQRASHERAAVYAILDEALVAHVGFVEDGRPVVIPICHWRIGDTLYLHGAARSRLLETVASGAPLSIAVTLLDGLVLARSAFSHSMNYRSVVIFGGGHEVVDPDEKSRVLLALVDKMEPGRAALVRPPNPAELAATLVTAVPLAEATAKMRSGPPADAPADPAWPVWSGVAVVRQQVVAREPAET